MNTGWDWETVDMEIRQFIARTQALPGVFLAAQDEATAHAVAALEIVRELAESELVDEDENTVTCLYCGQTMLRGLQVTHIAHRPDCLYLRARRLVGEEEGEST